MYILKEIPVEGTYGENIKKRLSLNGFIELVEKYDIKWRFQMFEDEKESTGKRWAYKRSDQNPDAFAEFNYDENLGGIRIELPKSYAGEFFDLLTKLATDIDGVLLNEYYKPIPDKLIAHYKSKEYKNLNLTRYIEKSFGQNSLWLCVKTENQKELMNKLKLVESDTDNFVDGMIRSYGDGELMVTNPTNGWTVVHGSNLIYTQYENKKDYLDTSNHPQRTIDFVNNLSLEYGEVGFFMDGEKSNVYSAWYSTNGKLVFGYIEDELKKEEFGDCSEINELLMCDPESLSIEYCIDPIDFIYNEESKKLVKIAKQKCYFSIFDRIKRKPIDNKL